MEADLIGVTETWKTTPVKLPQPYADNYHPVWSNATRTSPLGRPSGGLLLLVHKKKFPDFTVLEHNQWWIFIRLGDSDSNTIVNLTYLKPDLDISLILESLQASLTDLQDKYRDDNVILAGDFNAHIRDENPLPLGLVEGTQLDAMRISYDPTLSSRGSQLLELLELSGYSVLNGRTASDRPARSTYVNCATSVIDLVWVRNTHLQHIEDLTVVYLASGSDHFPVLVTFLAPADATDPTPQRQVLSPPRSNRVRWDQGKMHDYQQALWRSERTQIDFRSENIDYISTNLTGAILEACEAAGILKEVKALPNRSTCNPWFDSDC